MEKGTGAGTTVTGPVPARLLNKGIQISGMLSTTMEAPGGHYRERSSPCFSCGSTEIEIDCGFFSLKNTIRKSSGPSAKCSSGSSSS